MKRRTTSGPGPVPSAVAWSDTHTLTHSRHHRHIIRLTSTARAADLHTVVNCINVFFDVLIIMSLLSVCVAVVYIPPDAQYKKCTPGMYHQQRKQADGYFLCDFNQTDLRSFWGAGFAASDQSQTCSRKRNREI